ncbi:DUF99 family protein [Methanoregula sp.]|uniref:endonuclease dU n=1 Tax=Methanoregula sp. TaxID=2052170 RepID=UPI0035635CA9
MHLPKKGLRAFGIAESYSGRVHSNLAGVVMRKDLRIDGFSFGQVTVGGTDATDTVLKMIQDLDRTDINAILLSGCVIAWFNILDPARITETTGIPVIGVTYEESPGLLDDIRYHFPGDQGRIDAYLKLGDRYPVELTKGHVSFLRSWGIGNEDAARLCRDFTHEGKIPEPLRVARLCARHLPCLPL